MDELSELFEGQSLKAIAGENGGGLIVGSMAGGLSTAQVVVIHSWQVIVDQ